MTLPDTLLTWFAIVTAGMVVSITLYRARREPPERLVAGIAAGLSLAGLLLVLLIWAGLEVGRLTGLLTTVGGLAIAAGSVSVARHVRRRRAEPPGRSPFDLS
jgi:peptidoglycan/LPS O-acetylase OafA/YrhL